MICASCPVRRDCLADELSSGLYPGGIRAGIGEDDLELLARTVNVYRATVADWHLSLLERAGRREAADDLDATRALRTLAAAAADSADMTVALALSVAANAPVGELGAALRAYLATLVRLAAAERAAGESGASPDMARWRLRLETRAAEVAQTAAPIPTQASDPADPALVGAA
jgi:hypothetical protein